MRLTRRGLLAGAGAGGALLLAFALARRDTSTALGEGAGEHVFDAFVRMARDGTVTVAVPFCEMGQGIATLAAQIIAMEMGADWRRVGLEPSPVSPAFGDAVLAARWSPLWLPAQVPLLSPLADEPDDFLARRRAADGPLMVTADGTALAAFERPLREAGAAVRGMLAQAAAERWAVDWQTCEARDHAIIHGNRRIGFGDLVEEAARQSPPDPLAFRADPPREAPSATFAAGALRFPRLDLPAKIDGSFTFAGDVRLPGLLHAAIAHGPQGASVLSSFDKDAAGAVRGLAGVVHTSRWLAAVATTWHAADKAVRAMEPRFRGERAGAIVDADRMAQALDTALRRGRAVRVDARGDPDALLATGALTVRYEVEPALHAPLETASATARLRGGRLELWLATQAPAAARDAAARAAGLSPGDVVVYALHAGGSFDARLDTRIAAEVAAIAKVMDGKDDGAFRERPIQLTWSRWQESLADFPRAPLSALVSAATTPDRRQILGWRTRMALPPTAIEAGARLLDAKSATEALGAARGRVDPLACEGALPPYNIPERAVDHVPVSLALPTGRYRGNAHGYAAFFTESFVDELAHRAGAEPLSFRTGMLEGQPRLVACLSGVARLAMWGGGGGGSGQGIACHRMDLLGGGDPDAPTRSGFIAVVATARQVDGALRVERLSAFADIGRIVNIDIARQQIEGGLVWGLAQAIGGTTSYDRGRPVSGRLAQLGLPLLADCPKVDVAFADSSEDPFDPGEIGSVAVAPAIANALFSATGLRFRRLPLLSEGL